MMVQFKLLILHTTFREGRAELPGIKNTRKGKNPFIQGQFVRFTTLIYNFFRGIFNILA